MNITDIFNEEGRMKKSRELFDIDVSEISIVDRTATGKKFQIQKSADSETLKIIDEYRTKIPGELEEAIDKLIEARKDEPEPEPEGSIKKVFKGRESGGLAGNLMRMGLLPRSVTSRWVEKALEPEIEKDTEFDELKKRAQDENKVISRTVGDTEYVFRPDGSVDTYGTRTSIEAQDINYGDGEIQKSKEKWPSLNKAFFPNWPRG